MLMTFIIILAFICDWVIGDPQNWTHPVRWIGRFISGGEGLARRAVGGEAAGLRRAGVVLGLATVMATMLTVWLALTITAFIWKPLWVLTALYLIYSALCLKELYRQTWRVEKALAGGYLEEARQRLSWVVGRDTAKLDEAGIRRAVIETLAENLSDGVVAPMFYLALGGPVLAWGYKAVNTLDSMVGYKNEKYLDLGRFSAKLDDVANYIPARLTALLLIASARLQGHDWRSAKKIWLKDGRLHSSPNSGHPEAAMAGALGVWLGGPGYYGGTLVEKPAINNGAGEVDGGRVRAAEDMMVGAAVLMLALVLIRVIIL